MMTLRTSSGPNKAWRAGWVGKTGGAATAASFPAAQAAMTAPLGIAGAGHPFAEPGIAAELDRREAEVEQGFTRLEAVLSSLAPQQFAEGFPARATAALANLGIAADADWFVSDWARPLDMAEIYRRSALRLFARLVETGSERQRFVCDDGEPVDELARRFGFHAVDITPCADGRLAGLLGTVLRVPLSIVTSRRSYAGAMFGVADALRDWQSVELARFLHARENAGDTGSRYLKVGVYHYSSVDPTHKGCAAHGSNTAVAMNALHERLLQFRDAVQAVHAAGDQVALLMVGVDTDTDAIRVHVPDAAGRMDARRFVDAAALYATTRSMSREAAKDAVRRAVADCAGVDPADPRTEGMRWFCGYLLKNNIAQVDAVLRKFKGPYPVAGHAERLIVIGDPVDDVQLRNLAFQAQMASVEEGRGDLAIGLHILEQTSSHGVPVLVLRNYVPEIPGDREAAAKAAQRMQAAAVKMAGSHPVTVEAALRPAGGGRLEFLKTDVAGEQP